MARCLMVFRRKDKYFRIPDAEVEEWDEVCEELDDQPTFIERVEGWAPYTRAYRLPNGSVYLVAQTGDDIGE